MRWLAAMALCLAAPAAAQDARDEVSAVAADLILPTRRYDHAVLGDGVEWGGLEITWRYCPKCRGHDPLVAVIVLPDTRVFEDVEARVVDADGDGLREVLVVETDLQRGASLAVYGPEGKRAATPFIGTRHRWLAPAGVGDFDGDGQPEIAYVDQPHRAQELVFVRQQGKRLVEVARIPGLSNHRIGDRTITSAVRTCNDVTEVILPDAAWTRLVAARLKGRRIVTRDAGPFQGAVDLERATAC